MVSETVFLWTVGGIISALSILGTAVYMNRRKMNSLYQRLFGFQRDETDEGFVHRTDKKLNKTEQQLGQIEDKMDEQHQILLDTMKERTDEPTKRVDDDD